MNWGIFGIWYPRIMFSGTVELLETYILLKIKLVIDYTLIDYKFISSNFRLQYRKEAK